MSKLLHKLTITEAVLKVLGQGSAGRTVLESMAKLLLAKMPAVVAVVRGAVLRQSCQELIILARGLLGLLGSTEVEADAVEKMKCHFTLLRQLIAQHGYWRDQDRNMLERRTAIEAFVPEMAQVSKDVASKDMKEWPDIQHMVKRFIVWQEALPSGSHGVSLTFDNPR